MAGASGTFCGLPSAKVSDKVALSPSVIVFRSSVAVNAAARRTGGANQTSPATRMLADRSRDGLRHGTLSFNCDNTLRMDRSADFCLRNRIAQVSRGHGAAPHGSGSPLAHAIWTI